MVKPQKKHIAKVKHHLKKAVKHPYVWRHRIILIILAFAIFAGNIMYLFGLWYANSEKSKPLEIGVSFDADYARYYDLDPKETFMALRDDLGFKRFRLVSKWSSIEREQGKFDFTELDWQVDKINEVGGKFTLAMGLRQPRWPECHAPEWIHGREKDFWYPELKKFIVAVSERYRDHPALDSYQLENEFWLGVFGECKAFGTERDRLVEEFNLLKQTDDNTPIILSMANNYFGLPLGKPRADEVGVSIYKRVFDFTITKRYLEYPFPPWYYGARAGMMKALTGKSSVVHELQAEPWTPGGVKEGTLAEQYKSMDPVRLSQRIKYATDGGFRQIDLWGGEWWFYHKKNNNPELWETMRKSLDEAAKREDEN